jgi:hypothetical protein
MSPPPPVPAPPVAPALLTFDPVASEEAVLALRRAAEGAGLERARHERALAAALELWLGRDGDAVRRDGGEVTRGWFDLEVELRRLATAVRLAVVEAEQENRRRLGAYADAVAAYRAAHPGVPGLDG